MTATNEITDRAAWPHLVERRKQERRQALLGRFQRPDVPEWVRRIERAHSLDKLALQASIDAALVAQRLHDKLHTVQHGPDGSTVYGPQKDCEFCELTEGDQEQENLLWEHAQGEHRDSVSGPHPRCTGCEIHLTASELIREHTGR